ncbi:hypothetical protein [Clostridium sp. UBA4548]|uniref:hypothetical protein n=1 Tax=Clostridium sp. UBA4548 TaxID=1946361 RepID=UPI0025C44B2E|nr:hypothetical protein [Clostridium sp. UBA4548]
MKLEIIKNYEMKKFICKLIDSKTGVLISIEHGKTPTEVIKKINTNIENCTNLKAKYIWTQFKKLVLNVPISLWFE